LLRIILGASGQCFPGWTSCEQEELDLCRPGDWERFDPDSIDALLAEHVWEHLDLLQGERAAARCLRYLKPGGYIRCAVPDGWFRSFWYQRMVQPGGPGPADHPAAGHRVLHTHASLEAMFRRAGYRVELLEYCDPWGRFHFRHWDPKEGFVYRSLRYDHRNQDGELGFVSLIVDAVKPRSSAQSSRT